MSRIKFQSARSNRRVDLHRLAQCRLTLQFTFVLAAVCCNAALAANPAKSASGELTKMFYVAPNAAGDASGRTSAAPANFRDSNFWAAIRQALQDSSVIVKFLDGKYLVSADENREMPTLVLSKIGEPNHQLTVEGVSDRGTLFTRLESDPEQNEKEPGFLQISRSHNVVVRNLHFTGKQAIGYATHFSGKNILIENCSWIDLPGVHYGATGTDKDSDHIAFKNCVFKRVGRGRSAHMAYNAYGPRHIGFVNCWFEDCSGDYLRFRDSTDFGVVAGCTFKSTGTYLSGNMPFISIPQFNDDDPEKPTGKPNYEYFGTHFLIFNNSFIYQSDQPSGERVAMIFHHSGFDPPGCNYLLTPEQAQLLKEGDSAARKSLMQENFHIDANRIHFFNNSCTGVEMNVAYRSHAAHGAKSKGWKGIIDISEVVNSSRILSDESKALTFFDHGSAATSR